MPDPKTPPKPRLGRGLSSLIKPTVPTQSPSEAQPGPAQPSEASGEPKHVPIQQIAPNPHQPRRNFDPGELEELCQSIRQDGILQPLIITNAPEGSDSEKPYLLIAGERRLRAAQQAGLHDVPCIFRRANDRQLLEWAIIENIQRADLNPIERAQGYQDYMDRFNLTQQAAAERLGQARATIANHLRLLDLCDTARYLVAAGSLSFGHAKILAGLSAPAQQDRQAKLADKCVREDLSVRQLEDLLKTPEKTKTATASQESPEKPAYIRDLEEQLTNVIGTKVAIQPGRKKHTGRIVLDYYSLDDFDRLTATLGLSNTS